MRCCDGAREARIRQVASQIESLRDHYDADRRAVNEGVDELLRSWHGDGATAFQASWYGDCSTVAPAQVLLGATHKPDSFVSQLRDYADKMEHAQHDHWIQMAVLAAMTVVNVAQAGLDPATNAAEVGMVATDAVGTGFDLADVGTLAFKGAVAGFGSDLAGQAGADVWDHFFESGFDQTGDHAVGLFDPAELVVDTVGGAMGGAMIGGSAHIAGAILQSSRSAGGP